MIIIMTRNFCKISVGYITNPEFYYLQETSDVDKGWKYHEFNRYDPKISNAKNAVTQKCTKSTEVSRSHLRKKQID